MCECNTVLKSEKAGSLVESSEHIYKLINNSNSKESLNSMEETQTSEDLGHWYAQSAHAISFISA